MPLPPRKKMPPPKGYTGWEGEVPTRRHLSYWAETRPDANVALRLPPDVVGIDVDAYGDKRGDQTLDALEGRLGPLPPTCLSSSKPLPSGIRLFRVPEGTRLTGDAGPGIEIVQFHHRFVVAWPSIHPKTGDTYEWYNPLGERLSEPPRREDLSELPDDWLEALSYSKRQPRTRQGSGRKQQRTNGGKPRVGAGAVEEVSREVEAVLARAALSLPNGRHQAALESTIRLARLEERGYPGATYALEQLAVVFQQMVADRSEPEEASGEWDDLVEGARAKVATTQATMPAWRDELELSPAALVGLPGDFVRTLLPHTEADPAALLIDLLVSFGNAVGPRPHAFADGSEHPARLNAVLVGSTSRGRKGTARARVREVFRIADCEWSRLEAGGLSSGEGLIKALSLEAERAEDAEVLDEGDPGVSGWAVAEPADLRRLIVEPEFARVLTASGRDNSTLSMIIRDLWDSGTVRVMVKDPYGVEGAHVSIIGHITEEELRRRLNSTEVANGFANRFLFIATSRSKLLPHGGEVPSEDMQRLGENIRRRLHIARGVRRLRRSSEADCIFR